MSNRFRSRFRFLGHVEPEILAAVLRRSDLHVYLSVPFVLSWSVLNALACGCVVLAGLPHGVCFPSLCPAADEGWHPGPVIEVEVAEADLAWLGLEDADG